MGSTCDSTCGDERRQAVAALRGLLGRRADDFRADPGTLAGLLGYGVEDFHREWLDFQRHNRRTLLLAPRGHGKSSIAGVSYVLWRVICDPDVRVLIVSNTHEQARIFLREVRHHLEGNAGFRAVFGDLRAGKWSDSELLVKRDRIAKEATVTAAGANGVVVGRHFDVVIGDDIVDEESSWCEGQRSKLLTWFHKTLFPCVEPDGELHLIGTRYHGGDLYGEVIRGAQASGGWAVRVDCAVGEDGGVLWPGRYSEDFLKALRRELGEVVFSCQYQNCPSGGELAIFREDWFQYYDTLPLEPAVGGGMSTVPLRVFQGVDLAISQRDGSDYFAVVTIGVDANHDVYVLDVFRGHLTFDRQLRKIRELAERFRPIRIAVEANAYQDALPSELIRTTGLPVRRVRHVRDKMVRAMRLSPQFENGKIFLKRSMPELVSELQLFPRAAHDDLFDALEMAVSESVCSGVLVAGQY